MSGYGGNYSSNGTTTEVVFNTGSTTQQVGFSTRVVSGGGTSNYEQLSNLPTIEGVTLKGDLDLEDLGVVEITEEQINELFK